LRGWSVDIFVWQINAWQIEAWQIKDSRFASPKRHPCGMTNICSEKPAHLSRVMGRE